MTQHPLPIILRFLPIAALLAPSLAAATPAQGHAGAEPTSAVAPKDLRTLDRAARQKTWCVERKATPSAKPTKQCKTREAWIREGNDPLREY